MKDKNNSKISIVVVPETKKVKRLTIPAWLPKAILISFISIFLVLFLSINNIHSSYANLKQEYDDKVFEMANLEKENKIKGEKIDELRYKVDEMKGKTDEVECKLREIDKLQKRLEKMAGIENASRGGNSRRNIDDLENYDMNCEEDVELLKEMLDDKEKEIETFIEDVEKQFAYLETVPDKMPAEGRLTSKYGNRKDPFGKGYRFHQGIDIANDRGTDIRAAGSGVITFVGYRGGYGKTIIIDHGNGYKTLYGHNSKNLVKIGDRVEKGEVIAKIGSTGRSTGPHLHFEVHKGDKSINPFEVLK